MKYEEKQSWLCNQIVKEARDAIIMADREGIIRLWNKGAESVFGFSPVETIGRSLHIIIPESLREVMIRVTIRLWRLAKASIPMNFWPCQPSRRMAAGYRWNSP